MTHHVLDQKTIDFFRHLVEELEDINKRTTSGGWSTHTIIPIKTVIDGIYKFIGRAIIKL